MLYFSRNISFAMNRNKMDLSAVELGTRVVKYLLEGLAVAVAMVIIPRRVPGLEEIVSVSVVAALVFAILDLLSPSVGLTARQGAGFGLGANLVGFPGGGRA
jgi:ABC-type Co2+ transport system permease subunit